MTQQTISKMETVQTAVEWLQECLQLNLSYEQKMQYEGLFQQAKEIEKEQIINAHIEGQRVFDKHPHTQYTNDQAELYYNETYGTEG